MEFLKIMKLSWNWAMGLGLSVKLIQQKKNLKHKDEFQKEEAIKWNIKSVFCKALP